MAFALSLDAHTVHAQITFTDVTGAAGVSHQSETYGASWGDLNGDGYPDLYANNHRTRDSLYLNKGNGTFVDIGNQVHTWVYHEHADTHGGSWADFDNDGDQDLLVSTGAGNPSQFLVNEHGALIDRTAEFGIEIPAVSARLPIWLDFNGDHLLDFVMANKNGTAKVYKQNSSGTAFTDATGSTKLLCTGNQYGQLYDATGNGRLDYMCAGEAKFPMAIYNTQPTPWQMIFDSTAPNSLFPLVSHVTDAIIGDFNNDQRLDYFLLSGTQTRPSGVQQGGSNYFEAQIAGGVKGFKFISAGSITFAVDWNKAGEGTPVDLNKIEIGANARHPSAIPFTLDPSDSTVSGMPPVITKLANLPTMQIGYDRAAKRWTTVIQTSLIGMLTSSGSEAYFEVSSTATISSLQATGLWGGDKPARPTLMMNYSGGYSDETVAAGLSAKVQCGSVTTGDFDNDMDLDLYLACRTGASNIQNILYENQGDGTFVAVPSAGGAGGPVGVAVASGAGTADSVITADYDVDGFLDLFVTNGLNLRPLYYGGPNKLFHNQGNGNHWIELQLDGTRSERDAVGTRIKATANGVTQLRVLNGGYHRWSQEHTPSHFGLAGNTKVDLRVEWASGSVETYTNVPADKLYRITEGRGISLFSDPPPPPPPPPTPTDTGFKAPTANQSDSGGDGNGYQTNPTNAYVADGSSALDVNSGTNTNTSCTNGGKDKHRYYSFGLDIPAESTINGIEVKLTAKADSASGSPKICVQLSWNGGASWTSAKSTSTLGSSLKSYTLGANTNTWGRTWNAADFADANFMIRIIDVSSSTARDFNLDGVAVRASYQ